MQTSVAIDATFSRRDCQSGLDHDLDRVPARRCQAGDPLPEIPRQVTRPVPSPARGLRAEQFRRMFGRRPACQRQRSRVDANREPSPRTILPFRAGRRARRTRLGVPWSALRELRFEPRGGEGGARRHETLEDGRSCRQQAADCIHDGLRGGCVHRRRLGPSAPVGRP